MTVLAVAHRRVDAATNSAAKNHTYWFPRLKCGHVCYFQCKEQFYGHVLLVDI